MGRYEKGRFRRLEDDFQQIPGIQTKDGSPIGTDIPDFFHLLVEFLRGLKIRQENQIVVFSNLSVFFINIADFAG